MRLLSAAVPLFCVVLGGCGGETADDGPAPGTIAGRVRLGPIMPVCHEGTPCDGVYKGAKVMISANGVLVERATASDAGAFQAEVAPGAYEVGVAVEGPLPRCTPQQVAVKAGATVHVEIDCDSGIR